MSTGESEQAYTVEDIKSELRRAVRQLSELTRSDATFDQFCEQVLAKVVELTGAHGSLLWQSNAGGNIQITHRNIPPELRLDISEVKHRQVVNQVIEQAKPACLDSDALREQGGVAADGNTTSCLLFLAPVFNRKRESCGALELLQRGQVSDTARDGYLKFLIRIADLFQRWHEQHDLERLSHSAEKMSTTMEFVSEVHSSIDFSETAFTVANESRRLLNCDRVSFARWNGSACKVLAVSSQDRFDNRANVIRKLGNLATSSVAGNVPLWITGDTNGLAPEIVNRVNDYMDEAHSRTLAVIPLVKKPPADSQLDSTPKKNKTKKLGALIVEYFDEDVPKEKVIDSVQLITNHSQIAIANASEHDQIFLRPLWKRLGDLSWFLFHDHYAKAMTAIGALVLFILYLVIVPAELKMRVDGIIQPTERTNIFAQAEGVVKDVHVKQGDTVTAGQVLLQMENADLKLNLEDARGQLKIVKERMAFVNSRISNDTDLSAAEENELWGESHQLQAQIKNLERRLGLLSQKQEMLTIASPMDGTVVTWDVDNRLTDLPISKNQHVLAIANYDGDWQAELRIPENQVGYVVSAMESADESLDVEFRVSTNANLLFRGKLMHLSNRTDQGESGVPEFRAVVKADVSALKELRQGAGLTAKIHCGQHRTGFVWFYQVIDYLRTNVFF